MQDLIGILIAFLILGVLIFKKVDFGKSILVAVGVLLLIANPSMEGLRWVYEIGTSYDTLSLVAIIISIGYLGFLYKDTDQVYRMIRELRGMVPDRRLVIASIPAIFGLMPMPGGALVSAPMIDEEGDALGTNGIIKTVTNWWFRHIWFTIYVISPGLIIAAALAGDVSVYQIALYNIPIFIVQLFAGFYWLRDRVDHSDSKETSFKIPVLIWEFMPIIIALLLNLVPTLINKVGLAKVPVVPFYISIVVAITFIIFQNRDRYNFKEMRSALKEGFSFDLLMASFGIMIFKGLIKKTEALGPAVSSLQAHIPLFLVVILVAVGIGLMFGHLPSAIGVGFSILIPILPVVSMKTVGLVYIFIYLGYLVSPIHLCIILTVEYFKTSLKMFYDEIKVPFTILVIATIVWLLVSGAFFAF